MFPDFLTEPVDSVARKLLGCILTRTIDGHQIPVRIVETEAYDQDDEASHAFGGQRKRNAVMFGNPGHLYVYFTYGMHYCCNVVTGEEGYGSGVLIRAAELMVNQIDPRALKVLEKNRRGAAVIQLTNGPAKLAQALALDITWNGHNLRSKPLTLHVGGLKKGENVVTSPRIGISRAKDIHRRYYIDGNPYVSR